MLHKAPTIKDVAARAGVSFKTVSRVINRHPSVNPAMREAVEQAMAALGYRPHQAARALRSNRSYAIALLSGWDSEPPGLFHREADEEPYFSEFFSELSIGCGLACRENAYHLIFEFLTYTDHPKALASIESLLDNIRPDGLLLCPPLCDLPWLLDLLDSREVRYARLLPGIDLDRGLSFQIDDFNAAEAITQLLLEADHLRLAMITGPSDHLAATHRLKGFQHAAAAVAGTELQVKEGNFTLQSGYRAAMELLRLPEAPTAIFAGNDAMAAGVIKAATELGIAVPQQLSVVGFDDTMIARMTNPPLTTIRQPIFELARRASDALIQSANAGDQLNAELVRLDYSITRRQSIAPSPSR